MINQIAYTLGKKWIPRKFRRILQSRIIRSTVARPPYTDLRVEIIGFFESATGMGEAARNCAKELKNANLRVRTVALEKAFLKKSELEWDFENTLLPDETVNLRIFHVNPDQLSWAISQAIGKKAFAQSYNIGYWAWELPRIPNNWSDALSYINEIVTPSNFSAAAIQNSAPEASVTVVPHTIKTDFSVQPMRQQLNIPKDAFLVSTIFRPDSSLERKNPMALIASFLNAFTDQDNAYLVLKTHCGENKTAFNEIKALCQNRKHIQIVDKIWTREQINGLIKDSDIYASLHRSEGFGLTLAEAKRIGTPVMATGWSGNMDFCTEKDTILVNYDLIGVASSHPAFKNMKSCYWANPDIEQVSQLLRHFYSDRSKLNDYRNQDSTVSIPELVKFLETFCV